MCVYLLLFYKLRLCHAHSPAFCFHPVNPAEITQGQVVVLKFIFLLTFYPLLVWISDNVFNHCSVDEYLLYYHFAPTINSAKVNIHTCVS